MRETILICVQLTETKTAETTTHGLRGLGNKLMMKPNFKTLTAKVIFKF
jgi:hypothetical protein